MTDAVDTAIDNALLTPQAASSGSASITNRPLKDLIELAKFRRALDQVADPRGGLTFVKLVHPGSV